MTPREPFESRTDSKLEYARLHLQELRDTPNSVTAGQPFARAHEESCLFHVIGAMDAFLQEINAAYSLGLEMYQVNERSLARGLEKTGTKCAALDEIRAVLDSETANWLNVAVELRNHGTHRSSVPRAYHVGGVEHGLVYYRHPRDGYEIKQNVPDFLESVIENMQTLIAQLRITLPID